VESRPHAADGEILQGREIEDAVEHERARGRGFGAGVADGRDVPADRGTGAARPA
jgi:hypothetical protein